MARTKPPIRQKKTKPDKITPPNSSRRKAPVRVQTPNDHPVDLKVTTKVIPHHPPYEPKPGEQTEPTYCELTTGMHDPSDAIAHEKATGNKDPLKITDTIHSAASTADGRVTVIDPQREAAEILVEEQKTVPYQALIKYNPSMPDMCEYLCEAHGLTDVDLCRTLKIRIQTLWAWKKRYPELKKAIQRGRDVYDCHGAEISLRTRFLGYTTEKTEIKTGVNFKTGAPMKQKTVTTQYVPPDVGAIKMFLYNRDPGRWKEQRLVHMTAEQRLEVEAKNKNVNVNVDLPNPITPDMTDQKAQQIYLDFMTGDIL